jgi:peroxiredoxin
MNRPRLFHPIRLIAGLLVLGLLMVPAYFFLLRDPSDATIRRAVLLDTRHDSGVGVGLDLGQQAPDFEFSTSDGERVRLSDFQGRPLVINFWATWCTSCLSEMPDLKALQAKMGGDAFNVLAVNADQSRADAKEFIDFIQTQFVYAMDPGLVLTDAYGVYGLPLSVFLDANGVVRGVYRGHATPEILDTYVTAAINAEPPGEVPGVLRIISTIYRPRTLTISTTGPGNLTFTSKALRCDASYCATDALKDGLTGLSGMTNVRFSDSPEGDPSLTVDFDTSTLSDEDVVTAVRQILEGLDDPVYKLPLQVEFRAE